MSALISVVPIQLGWHLLGQQDPTPGAGRNTESMEATVEMFGLIDYGTREVRLLSPAIPTDSAPMTSDTNIVNVTMTSLFTGTSELFEGPVLAESVVLFQTGIGGDVDRAGSSDGDDVMPVCLLELNLLYAVVSSTVSFYLPCLAMLLIYYKLYQVSLYRLIDYKAVSDGGV